MKKILESCKKIYNKDEPLKIEWGIAILVAIIMLLIFSYIDVQSLTIWSTNILDCIANGDITEYYSYTALNKYNLAHQYVSGTLYSLILWAIWNIPIWAIQYFGGISIVNNLILLIWSKLFLVGTLGVTLFITYKICCILFKDKKISKWITFLSATFLYTYIGVFYAGQNDILICMFATLGLYYLIKGKNIWFYIFSAIAISTKYFYLIPYIPLILLTEKKIWKIIVKLGAGVLPIIAFRLMVGQFPMYEISAQTNASAGILEGFFGSSLEVANGSSVSFFILAFIVICFIAYMTKPKTKEMRDNYIIYFAAVPILAMVMFSTYYEFYRPILLMPSLMILYGFKPKLFRINIILDTFMCATSFVSLSITNNYLFNTRFSMSNSILTTKLIGIEKIHPASLNEFFVNIFGNNIDLITNLCTTIFFTALAIIIVINYPKFNFYKDSQEEIQKPERWIIWIRSLMVVPAIALLLFCVIKNV